MNNIKKTILGGVFWTTVQTVINAGFGLIIQLVLAKILFPRDFGIVGMAVVFISFIEVFNELGMGSALIQKKKELLTPSHFDTAFWTGILWSSLLFLFIFLITPFVADFYKEDQLNNILPIISLSILLSPLSLVHKAKLTKAMSFKKLAIINNSSNIISGITALILAFTGFGVWALVFHLILRTAISIPLFFKATRWLPSMQWSKDCFKEIFGFGAYTTITSLLNKISGKTDYLIIGKFVGASALGYYAFALIFTTTLRNQLVSVINRVLYPVYVSVQDDKKKMLHLFLKIVSLNNLIVYPFIVGVFLFSQEVVPAFFGDKWLDSIIIIKILCFAVLFQMLNNSHTTLLRASGEVRLEFILQLIKSLMFFVPSIILGVHFYGLTGAAIGFTVATFLSITLSFFFMNKVFDLKFKQIIVAVKVPLIMFVFCLITTEFLKTLIDWRFCLIYYLIAVFVIYFWLAKTQIRSLFNEVKDSLRKNKRD